MDDNSEQDKRGEMSQDRKSLVKSSQVRSGRHRASRIRSDENRAREEKRRGVTYGSEVADEIHYGKIELN